MKEHLTISLIQADLYWEEIDANQAMFEEKIWEIDETDLIVLPEMFTTGFSMEPEPLAEPPGGKTFKWMRQMAKQKQAAITGSYIIKEGGQYFNRLYFVYPDGTAHHYDKKHLFSLAGEDEKYSPGTDRLVIDYHGWKICTLICYDLRFPVWASSQQSNERLHEYDLLLYVANWPDTRIQAWDALLKARAIENLSFCAGVNRTGEDALSKKYPGHSAVYSFDGDTLAFSQQEENLSATLSRTDLDAFRKQFPFQEDADTFRIG